MMHLNVVVLVVGLTGTLLAGSVSANIDPHAGNFYSIPRAQSPWDVRSIGGPNRNGIESGVQSEGYVRKNIDSAKESE